MIDRGDAVQFIAYANISPAIGSVITDGFASLHELQTIYGCRDLYTLYELGCVNAYNKALSEQAINGAR